MQSINPPKEEFFKSLNSETLSREWELFMVKSLPTIGAGPTGAGKEEVCWGWQ